MPNGYMGKILWVNLSDNSFQEEEISEKIYRQYFGGYALAAKFIYENISAKTDPLNPESILGLFPGLLTGTITPMSGRFMTCGKSPLTGTWGDANCGGYFGPEIKKCGYDGILILGAAEIPKYIAIIDGEKQLLDASDVWGLDAVEAETKLTEKHEKSRVALIGQGGEKLSRISGIVTDKGRIAARCGLGAIMGSKKLKAIVLKGTQSVSIADKSSLLEYVKKYNQGINTASTGAIYVWKTLGTSGLNAIVGKTGDAPIKNWGGYCDADFPMEKLQKIDGTEINKYKTAEYGCASCPVQCGGKMKVPEAGLEETHLPEYETCASFGHMLLNDDLLSLFKVNDLCNRAGIDTISTGSTIAFAIECFENGIISLEDTDGLKLTWGNSEAIIELTKRIANREGFGDVLADGTKIASEKIGKGAEKYAIHSLGQEIAMHDSKYYKSLGQTYAFDPTPGKHTAPSVDLMVAGPLIKPNGLVEGFSLPRRFKRPGPDRDEAQMLCVGLKRATNALGLCEFINLFQKYPLLEVIKAVTGWDISIEELLNVGYRSQTLRQAFTLREGVMIAENRLPGRTIGDPPFLEGPHKGKTIDYVGDYRGYCEKMGWNPLNGYPLEETLKKLDLDYVIKDFY
ncbi:MAG: aldehyde ferredoxin oxidoreductase family protein [Promethearchaeota archaeon]